MIGSKRTFLRIRHFGSRHFFAFLACALVISCFTWFVTFGTWNAFEADGKSYFGELYYDHHVACLLQGRLDVPPEAIGVEAFVHEGKYYGYFGITPALLRLPLALVVPRGAVTWNRAMLVIACGINLVAAYLILVTARNLLRPETVPSRGERALEAVFLLAVGLGSTNIHLASCSIVHHEAIIWAGAFALLFYWFFLKLLTAPRMTYLLLAGVCALLALHARPTTGAGPILCLGVFAIAPLLIAGVRWLRRSLGRQGSSGSSQDPTLNPNPQRKFTMGYEAAAALFVLLGASSYALLNYGKFGTINGLPLHLYAQFNPQQVERLRARTHHVENFRYGAYNYLWPGKVEVRSSFPWMVLTRWHTEFPESITSLSGEDESGSLDPNQSDLLWHIEIPGSRTHRAMFEEFGSITLIACALFLMSLVGLGYGLFASSRASPFRLPVLASLLIGSHIFFACTVLHRYVHDAFPFFVLAGALGLQTVLALRRRRPKLALTVLFISLSLVSAYMNLALTLVYQREQIVRAEAAFLGAPTQLSADKAAQFDQWRRSIDRLFGRHDMNNPG
jgi:hypothetical protein